MAWSPWMQKAFSSYQEDEKRRHARLTGGGAASYASRPAPTGYRWDFVTSQGVRVTSQNEPVVALVRAA